MYVRNQVYYFKAYRYFMDNNSQTDNDGVAEGRSRERTMYRFQWTWPVLITAVVCIGMVIASLCAVIQVMKYSNTIYLMATIGILLLIILGCLYYLSGIPLSLRIHRDCLVVSRFVYNVSIPWACIKGVKLISGKQLKNSINEGGAKRGFGFGYMGRQHTRELGYFYLYATSLYNLVLIETDQRNYIISVPDCEKFMEEINDRMSEAL